VTLDGIPRASSRRDRRRLERFAEVREDLPDGARFGDERDQPDASDRKWVEARTQFQQWNCVLPALKRDLIGKLPRMRRAGRTDVSDLQVSVNALRPVYAAALWGGVRGGFRQTQDGRLEGIAG